MNQREKFILSLVLVVLFLLSLAMYYFLKY